MFEANVTWAVRVVLIVSIVLEAKNAAFDVGAIVFEAKVDWVDTVFIVLDEYTAVLEENVA